MKKYLLTVTFALSTLTMVVEATASPVGGGRDIGLQSPTVTRQQAQPAPAPAPAAQAQRAGTPAATPPAAPRPSPWKGILGGALLGLGLGALLSSMGIGGAMASVISTVLMVLLVGMAGLFIYRMFKRRDTPANSSLRGFNQPLPAGATPEIGSGQPKAYKAPKGGYPKPAAEPASTPVPAPAPAPQWGVPDGFDNEAFLRHAKSSFIRMQAAWDKADTNDLREFTTPEVFAELKMQIGERGETADITDVVSIDAELLGIENVGDVHLASVKFVGLIKTSPAAEAAPFAEVWNMAKPLDGSTGWVLAGIQQLS